MSLIVEKIRSLNKCVNDIENYLLMEHQILLDKKDTDNISEFVADAMITASKQKEQL